MEKTMQINGMMCNHCKMTVEKALKAVPGVENVEVDLAAKCAKITLNADVADDVLMDAVAKKGFTPMKMGISQVPSVLDGIFRIKISFAPHTSPRAS